MTAFTVALQGHDGLGNYDSTVHQRLVPKDHMAVSQNEHNSTLMNMILEHSVLISKFTG